MRAKQSDNVKRWIVSDSIGHITSDLSLLNWKNPEYVECVYREIWTAPRCGVASIVQIGDTLVRITMKQPGWKIAVIRVLLLLVHLGIWKMRWSFWMKRVNGILIKQVP